MSIVTLLKNGRNKELTTKLSVEFPSSLFGIMETPKAPPLTNNNAMVGTAFDYLLRLNLERLNKKTVILNKPWVDEKYLRVIKSRLKRSGELNISKDVDKHFKKVSICYNDFMRNGKNSETVLKCCIYLAKLRHVMFMKQIMPDITAPEIDDMKDIETMLNLVDFSKFTAKKKCYLAPNFGGPYCGLGGGDGDIIIDDILIDIKSNQKWQLERSALNQLLCYYMMIAAGGINGNPYDKPVKRIGIYFSRFGELWDNDISLHGTPETFEKMTDWLKEYKSKLSLTNYFK